MNYFFKIMRVLFFLGCTCANAQNEFSKWYFGANAGLDFSTQPPTVLTNGSLNTVEGVASVCDASGNLLFYTDGLQVYTSTHTVMANGSGLFGNQSTTQSAVIVKQPGNNNLYYIFTADQYCGANGYCYSVVDMALAAGQGSITIKNAMLYTPTSEKQVAVRHCNGKDVWIVSHHCGSNEFRTFLLTATGLNNVPVTSAVGEMVDSYNASPQGQIKVSPDGKKLALASPRTFSSVAVGGFHLFDFDAATGVVSNSLTLLGGQSLNNPSSKAYGVEFSPDGTKLYGVAVTSYLPPCFPCVPTLHQWDICSTSTAAIVSSQYSITLSGNMGSLQRAIDNKIYLAVSGQSLSVINNPNGTGVAMSFVPNGQSLAPRVSAMGLPNYINMYARTPYTAFTNTIACQTVSFSAPPAPTFSSGCAASPYPPGGYLWNFGEPAAGAANTSTFVNPIHTYSSTGTYTVSLILFSNCSNDTLKSVVNITKLGPVVSVSGDFLICPGEVKTYTATGGGGYLWSDNTTAATATFAPLATTVYSVTASFNGCSTARLFTVTVNPCLGIAQNQMGRGLAIYPNPVSDRLFIEADAAGTVMIFDTKGRFVSEHKIYQGANQVNTGALTPGVYILQVRDEKGAWRAKIVKME